MSNRTESRKAGVKKIQESYRCKNFIEVYTFVLHVAFCYQTRFVLAHLAVGVFLDLFFGATDIIIAFSLSKREKPNH
jgi:hypothetical protein